MLKNITIGQYINGESLLHKATPKSKIIMTFIYIFVIFFFNKISTYVFGLFIILFLYKICKIPLRLVFNNFKSIFFILLFTSIINLFFNRSGEVILKFWIFKMTKESIFLTFLVIFRIFLLIAGVSILTYTTLPLDLARSVGDFFLPLKKFKFPVGEISTMLSIAIRFVPLLLSETQKIIIAQRARGADVYDRKLKKKIKFMIAILIPLLVSSFKRADELAIAMESRCYSIGAARTRYVVFKFNRCDFLLVVFGFIFFVFLFVVNHISFI